jgi:hypothetical protein
VTEKSDKKADKKKSALKMTPPGTPARKEDAPGKAAGGTANRDRFIDEARWSRRKQPPAPAKPKTTPPQGKPTPPPNPFSPAEIPGPWGDFWKAAMDFQMGLLRNATRFSPMGLALDVRLWSGALDEMIHQMAAEDPERETKVVSEAASYGTQLTAIMDVLDGLIDRLEPETAGAEDAEELRRAIERFRELKERITSV